MWLTEPYPGGTFFPSVRNNTDTYSCVINKLSPATTKQMSAVNMQTSAVSKQMFTTTAQAPATITQKPVTTKLLPAVNVQAPAATKQMSTTTAQAPAATTQKPVTTTCHLLSTCRRLLPLSRCPPPLHRRPPLFPAPPASHPQTRHPWASLLPASLCPPMPAGQSPSTPLGNSQIGKSGKPISLKPNLGGTAAQFGSLPNGEWTDRLSNNENHAPNLVNEFGCMKKTKLALCQCKLGSSQTFSIASHPSQSRKGNNRCNSDSWFPNAMPFNNHALRVH
ncbi:hypothetical protein DSO57_1002703 [Entomophthora muscae]|uniref:Uncharacterized protein n=1 Tax=Entomophthora muscae TaxID=34485 RepID=A0ACC2UIC7_9FUNG|nr:hypothetical protein DSO57_1002703 [Entomophthora muscae]